MRNAIFLLGSNVASGIISGIIVIYLNNKGLTTMAYLVFSLYVITVILIAVYVIKNWKLTKTEISGTFQQKINNKISIRPIGDQTFQIIDGNKLINKWSIKPNILLSMVKNRLIDAYAPDEERIVNETESNFELSMGNYAENNELDEDTITRFRFKPKDIVRFEKIAKNYQTTT